MLIIPQIRNTRLISGFLAIITIIVLITAMSNHSTLDEKTKRIEMEKTLMLNELSEMIDRHDAIEILSDSLKLQYEASKTKISVFLDSIKTLKLDKKSLVKLKSRIGKFKAENSQLLSEISKIENENYILINENLEFEKMLKSRDSITQILSEKYKHLVEDNGSLKSNINNYSTLYISNLFAEGAKRLTSKKRVVTTSYARRTKKFHAKFTVVKNKFLSKGYKTLYFQVLDSKMNVISNKGTVSFGNKTLIYSKKERINYQGKEFEVSTLIDKTNAENLIKGTYFICVIYNGDILAKTSVTLK